MLDWKHVGFLFAKASPSHISSKGTNKSHISKSGTIRSPTLGRRKLAFYLSLISVEQNPTKQIQQHQDV